MNSSAEAKATVIIAPLAPGSVSAESTIEATIWSLTPSPR